jgi:sugar/nucleoside kinase (ribokinase family)
MAERYSVFVGDVALDEYYRAEQWPGIADKAIVRTLPASPGGMIANAACVAAGLGMPVRFLAALNRGAITQLLLSDLQHNGVDTSLVVYDDTLPDAKTMIFLVGDEHTVLIPTMGITQIDISPAQLDILAGAQYIYTTPGEFAPLRCGDRTSADIIAYCRQRGAKLVYDLDVDYIRDGDDTRYRQVDIAFFNEIGFDHYRGATDARAAAERLLDYGVEIVVVTKAAQGCVIYTRTETVAVPGVPVTVVDVTGAGDTFGGSFVWACAHGQDIRSAATFANAMAARCVGQMGARLQVKG